MKYNPAVLERKRLRVVFWGLLALAVLVRALLWGVYRPVAYSDTASYKRLAGQLMQGWQQYDGSRTPGYPVFLALVGTDERAWLVQMVLGVLITLLVFTMAWEIARPLKTNLRIGFAFLAGLAHSLNLGQLFFEANLLTETLATFWVLLALAGWVFGMRQAPRRKLWLALGIGLAASLGAITRPLFVFLPAWLALWTAFSWQQPEMVDQATPAGERKASSWFTIGIARLKKSIAWVVAVCVPALVILGGWMGLLRIQYGFWGLSVMTGYHLIQNTGSFFEYVPDEYAAVRDTYLKYRAVQIAEHGTQANTIWDAITEMQAVSGLGFTGLSQLLSRLSIQLIVTHPGLYIRNILEGWWLFWRAPVYWSAEAMRWKNLLPVIKTLVLVERIFLVGCNLGFLIVTLLAAVWKSARQFLRLSTEFWFLAGAVWFTSIFQTFLDHGDNARFLVPLQSVVVICMAFILFEAWGQIRQKRTGL